MKKSVVILLVSFLFVFSLVGCGDNSSSGNNGGDNNTSSGDSSAITGETYSVGDFSVLVPDGWEYSPFYDSGGTEAVSNILAVHRGSNADYISGKIPGIQINYLGPGGSPASPRFYDDPEDIAPVTIGQHTWEGFSAYMAYSGTESTPVTILWTTIDGTLIQISATTLLGKKDQTEHPALDDPELSAIIASIALE